MRRVVAAAMLVLASADRAKPRLLAAELQQPHPALNGESRHVEIFPTAQLQQSDVELDGESLDVEAVAEDDVDPCLVADMTQMCERKVPHSKASRVTKNLDVDAGSLTLILEECACPDPTMVVSGRSGQLHSHPGRTRATFIYQYVGPSRSLGLGEQNTRYKCMSELERFALFAASRIAMFLSAGFAVSDDTAFLRLGTGGEALQYASAALGDTREVLADEYSANPRRGDGKQPWSSFQWRTRPNRWKDLDDAFKDALSALGKRRSGSVEALQALLGLEGIRDRDAVGDQGKGDFSEAVKKVKSVASNLDGSWTKRTRAKRSDAECQLTAVERAKEGSVAMMNLARLLQREVLRRTPEF